ncbi:UvrD-helicase domain-containing protein [Pelotomaculum terephthalicicum JT]|uniref:UvrD-helicase domain-containing protein n=2 Tax=Pelotomaculum TaxID=191373 RepID=UPI001F0423C8|nr:UvrD-helicase domain-containing protein [Pelotomaculum terephthalicicum]MCG9967293.1 UvrD-helicase domain-containing protein [Pelotomaculum terephthalicicum JT]
MFITDFHIHSKYSRATSRDCVPEVLEFWARRKGIGVIGTGDFTHPAWREELKEKLVPSGEGLYTLKNDFRKEDKVAGADFKPQFIVSGEISSIYKKNGRVRKVHNLIILPGLEHAESISHRLEAIGNLHSDGRPILGLDSRDLLEIVLDMCPEAIFIPAHIWTPHFSLYGAYSGFDDIMECFGDLAGYIYALETGLSSDPPMNWRLSALDDFTLVSNSDAHSPANLGREANIFDTVLSYQGVLDALKSRSTKKFHGTMEFFPEEGKYHYDGHRACKVCWKPADTKAAGGVCPVCGGRITVGVLHRVEALADREEGFVPPAAKHFESLVPLHEVVAASIGYTAASMKVKKKYDDLIRNLGPELFILREAPLNDIELAAGPCIAEGIRRLRCGKVEIQPGFDGEYGRIKIMDKSEIDMLSGQLCFFNDIPKTIEDIKVSANEAEPAPVLADTYPPDNGGDTIKTVPSGFPYGLNREQWEAVSSASPAIAVIAGPGTGKTKTLVCRIAYLVEKCGIDPSQVTAVTFTNKAANEMRVRLEKHFGNKRTAGAMTIGTFHSICLQILSKWRGKNNKTIIDEYNAVSIIEEILKDMQLKISPRDVMRRISLIKSGVAPAGDQQKTDVPAEVYALYCAQLERYGVMDYDDILLEVLKRFESANTESISERSLANSFSYLLVDEFQDINGIQYRLIKKWGEKSGSIFIIGDPDQSIYGFRGSDFRYFERFKADFPDLRQVRLTWNYRSTPEIIISAESVISKKAAGGRACSLDAKRESGAKVRLIETKDEFSEALFVAKEINRMVGGIDMLDTQTLSAPRRKRPAANQPRGFSDIVVLYRTNRQAEIVEQCFLKEGIQYVVVGRDEFLADKLVREAMAFFRFLLNPGDIASLLLYLKAKNIYSADLNQKVLESYVAGEKSVPSLIRIMERTELPPHEPGKPQNFMEMLRKYEPVINKEKPWKILDSWINDNSMSGVRCLELLLNSSVMHNKMSSFMQNLVLGRESDVVRSGSKVYSPEAVSLMTMHAAKGLEFPIVFICGVNDGMIPLRNSNPDFDIDEERRLFYVGMTRARDELILLTSRTPSPFTADISEEQLIREKTFTQKKMPQYKQVSLFD